MNSLPANTGLTWRELRVRCVLVPLARPVIAKVGEFDKFPVILLDLETEQGITGNAYVAPYLTPALRYLVPLINDLGEALKGKPVSPFDAYENGRRSLTLIGLTGLSLIAVSAIDMVMWDACAKSAQLPLCRYLGGSTGRVPAYNSNGLWLGALENIAAEAAELATQGGGFGAMKLRIGRDRLDDDRAAIRAVREGAGDDVVIMTDFNQGQTLGAALDRCQALDDEGLYWFEEPIRYDQFEGYAHLNQVLKTPIMLGENFYGPEDLSRAVDADAGTFLMPDVMRIGGVTGWMRSAAIAGAKGLQMSSHLFPEISAHLLRVTETAHWLEMVDWASPILANPFEVENGECIVPDRPGTGIDWNEDAIKHYLIDV